MRWLVGLMDPDDWKDLLTDVAVAVALVVLRKVIERRAPEVPDRDTPTPNRRRLR